MNMAVTIVPDLQYAVLFWLGPMWLRVIPGFLILKGNKDRTTDVQKVQTTTLGYLHLSIANHDTSVGGHGDISDSDEGSLAVCGDAQCYLESSEEGSEWRKSVTDFSVTLFPLVYLRR